MIDASGLGRSFRTRQVVVEAVRSIDLRVDAGEIVGFLGPNGAGKTTTLRMLTTLLEPTSGTATVAGADLRRDPAGVRRRIGYVPQGGATGTMARAGEELVDHGLLYGMARDDALAAAGDLFAQLDLDGLWARRCSTLSGGQRRRLDIAMGLVQSPSLVFLDEPTTGLDPQSRANLWEHIERLRSGLGTTVFLTTHYLDEADALCDRILVIDHGSIVAEGTPEELKHRVSGDAVTVGAVDPARTGELVARLAAAPGADEPRVVDELVTVRIPHSSTVLPGLLRRLADDDLDLASIEVRRPTLDDVFLSLTGRSLREEAS